MRASAPLVGRASELELLRGAAARARAGSPSAVLVHGEAGVGKSRLVTEAVAELGDAGFEILWGRAVRFATEVASYLPISHAFGQRWERAGPGSPTVLEQVSAAITARLEAGPVALVIDDLQWADVSSLDVLSFLVAGYADGQRLLVVGTYRDTDIGTAHPLHGWLADLVRMPGVSVLRLARLGRGDTEELFRAVVGTAASTALAGRAYERTRGNPYFTELLAGAVEPGSHRLPERLPTDLREALLSAWHRLSAPARELMHVLAVGGTPIGDDTLHQVAAALGIDAEKMPAGVAEACDAGLTRVDEPGGTLWFHHPLVAEALITTLLPSEVARLHAVYVEVWTAAAGVSERIRAAHLALHLDGAGDAPGALAWSLRAAEEAEQVRGYAEESRHLVRACELWPRAQPEGRNRLDAHGALLVRATRAAHRAGDYDTALSLALRVYELTVPQGDSLASSRILNQLNWLRMQHQGGVDLIPLLEAVDLSSHSPESPEHARAWAQVSWFEQWNGRAEAGTHAAEALERARASGSAETLVFALCVAANACSSEARSLVLADEALALARREGLTDMLEYGAVVRANCLQALGRSAEAGPFLRDTYLELRSSVAPHAAGGIAVYAATMLLMFGDWHTARQLLRDALSIRMAAYWVRTARLDLATLAARCGQVTTARLHLERAEELAGPVGVESVHVGAAVEVLDAAGDHAELMTLVASELGAMAVVDPVSADEMMILAARATLREIERHPDQRAAAPDALDRLRKIRDAVAPAMFEPVAPHDSLAPAFEACYEAHRHALVAAPGQQIDAWAKAMRMCDRAGLVWEGAQARHRLAVALLARRRPRHEVAAVLRDALRVAVDLGAEPLRGDIETVALQAHLDLGAADESPSTAARAWGDNTPAHVRLTSREQEVLGHLMAGRTYAEIAEALVISRKTVSVHVSNLLRKTGTSSRVELAALVRQSLHAGDEPSGHQGPEDPVGEI
ncbi:MAG: helix-turn-helix transcriptional regulator [Nocardioides sp.]